MGNERRTAVPADLDGVHRGKRAAVRILERWAGTWSDYRREVVEPIDAGDTALLDVRETGLGEGSGIPMEHRYAMSRTFRDRRIARAAAV